MGQLSYARLLLEQWRIPVKDIPASSHEGKKEADFLADFGGVRVLIEEKTKEDDPNYLANRAKELEQGGIHEETISIIRNETLSGIVRHAAKQLRSSADKQHDFRLMWLTATGVNAKAKCDQFVATLYGRTNIVERNAGGFRRCYYFRNSDFYRRVTVLDGAVAAYVYGTSITPKLCLNSLSPRYAALRQSSVVAHFGTAVEDPVDLEARGTAFVLDCDLNRKDEAPLLAYLEAKYKTGALMTLDLGYLTASMSLPKEEA